ncbi:hypothetical protein WA026_002680, partial [Henosepilachna vigintioctopunctata]
MQLYFGHLVQQDLIRGGSCIDNENIADFIENMALKMQQVKQEKIIGDINPDPLKNTKVIKQYFHNAEINAFKLQNNLSIDSPTEVTRTTVTIWDHIQRRHRDKELRGKSDGNRILMTVRDNLISESIP